MIEKVLAGIVLFLITSLIAYAFKVRQIYAVVPKLHRKSFLSDNGSVSEIVIYNKGTKVEEDINLEINQELKCELLASNSSNTVIENNVIKIDRIHSHSEESIILLVEDGVISYDDLKSVSSKEKAGIVVKKIEEVPPAASNVALSLSGIILFFSLLYWSGEIYDYSQSKYIDYKYSQLSEMGWSEIDDYLFSDLSDSYSNQEFPIRLLGVDIADKDIVLHYEVINKSAVPISVVLRDSKKLENEGRNDLPFKSIDVEPLEKEKISLIYPNLKQETLVLTSSINFGQKYIHGLTNTVDLNKYNKEKQKDAH